MARIWIIPTLLLFAGCQEPGTPEPGTGNAPEPALPTFAADEPTTFHTGETPIAAADAEQEPIAGQSSTDSDTDAAAADADEAGDVSVQILNWDQTQDLIGKHRGKIVVLDVWSTSCIPCMREFPYLVELQKKHGDDLVAISLNTDYLGIKSKPPEYYRERVLAFLQKQDATFQNVLSNVPSDELFALLEINSIPAVFVYDAAGKLVQRFDDSGNYGDDGFTYEDHVTPAVEELVSKSAAQ